MPISDGTSVCFYRYLLDHDMLHPTERYYPLRPELAESTFYLYQATKGHETVLKM